MILELLIITTIICFIIDISGFIYTIKNIIWKWVFNGKREYREFRLKPLDCSLCMTFWIGIIWISIFEFTLFNLLFVCLFAALAEDITGFIKIIKYLLNKVRDAIVLRLNN